MILKREITDEELTVVMLSCDWNNAQTRIKFAINGYFINVLSHDKEWDVKLAVGQFLANESYEKHINKHKSVV